MTSPNDPWIEIAPYKHLLLWNGVGMPASEYERQCFTDMLLKGQLDNLPDHVWLERDEKGAWTSSWRLAGARGLDQLCRGEAIKRAKWLAADEMRQRAKYYREVVDSRLSAPDEFIGAQLGPDAREKMKRRLSAFELFDAAYILGRGREDGSTLKAEEPGERRVHHEPKLLPSGHYGFRLEAQVASPTAQALIDEQRPGSGVKVDRTVAQFEVTMSPEIERFVETRLASIEEHLVDALELATARADKAEAELAKAEAALAKLTKDREKNSGLDTAMKIADLSLKFGEVERSTQHPDGRRETDTTHSVMLALLVLELAPPGIDRQLAVCYALVHDLLERWTLDTCTAWGLSDEERAAKRHRELEAMDHLQALGLPNITRLVREYEEQVTPEARIVRDVDKVTPKLTHLLNEGRALRAIGMTALSMRQKHEEQGQALAAQYPDHVSVRALFDDACRRCEAELLTEEPSVSETLAEIIDDNPLVRLWLRRPDGGQSCDFITHISAVHWDTTEVELQPGIQGVPRLTWDRRRAERNKQWLVTRIEVEDPSTPGWLTTPLVDGAPARV